jgi:AbrB family looped-hinge helix DNA binding protein
MAKVTSKLQVTIPKALAEQFGIQPGDEIEWSASADAIRLFPRGSGHTGEEDSIESRLRSFDQATQRQIERETSPPVRRRGRVRGWKREDLNDSGRSR